MKAENQKYHDSSEIIIDSRKYLVKLGEGVVPISANATYIFNANKQFRMIATLIKSSYEL